MKRVAILIATLCAITGCEKKEPPKQPASREPATIRVAAQTVQACMEATGTVQADLEGGAKILSPLAGAVEKIFVRIGDHVAKGAPLAAVRSSDVSDAFSGHLAAQAQLKQAERSYTLNRKLFEIGAVTQNDLLTSEANYEQSRAVVEGLRKKLDIYGAAAGSGGHGTLIVRAPISGNVVDIQAHLGDRFDTSTTLMTVADPGRSLVVANIYDTDIGKVRKGKPVTFTADVFPNSTFTGTVSYVSDVEDPDSKTVKTYIRLAGNTALLKQNMFLKLRIIEGEKRLPVIPKSAMIYKEGKFFVQVRNSTGFELKEVRPVRDISDKQTAVEGIKEGETIASAAIDLEQP